MPGVHFPITDVVDPLGQITSPDLAFQSELRGSRRASVQVSGHPPSQTAITPMIGIAKEGNLPGMPTAPFHGAGDSQGLAALAIAEEGGRTKVPDLLSRTTIAPQMQQALAGALSSSVLALQSGWPHDIDVTRETLVGVPQSIDAQLPTLVEMAGDPAEASASAASAQAEIDVVGDRDPALADAANTPAASLGGPGHALLDGSDADAPTGDELSVEPAPGMKIDTSEAPEGDNGVVTQPIDEDWQDDRSNRRPSELPEDRDVYAHW